ncbi:MAG: hypothetical protein PUP90_08060 [Nostoc sp. S4]|nr:hypothetical protein [Nostoc sp. S4]
MCLANIAIANNRAKDISRTCEKTIMPTTKPKSTLNLVSQLRRHLNYQEEFAANLGVSFKTVNPCENAHSTPSPMALK